MIHGPKRLRITALDQGHPNYGARAKSSM